MKIILLKTTKINSSFVRGGTELEITKAEAEKLIKSGVATEVKSFEELEKKSLEANKAKDTKIAELEKANKAKDTKIAELEKALAEKK